MSSAGAAMMTGVRRVTLTNPAWVDPDGTNNGQNTIPMSTGPGATQSVAAGNRLYFALPSPINGFVRVQCRYTDSLSGSASNASVAVEIYDATGTTILATLTGDGTQTDTFPGSGGGSPVFTGTNVFVPAGSLIRLRGNSGAPNSLTTASGTVFCYATAFNTDNYPITYDTK
jgi:hypothetical protein